MITCLPLPDGGYFVTGSFTSLNNTSVMNIARLRADGSLYPDYPAPDIRFGEISYSIAVQSDGRILMGTSVAKSDGQGSQPFGRLNADGTLDRSFEGVNIRPFTMLPMEDGRIVFGGQYPNLLMRYTAAGTIDSSYQPRVTGVNGAVQTMAMQADGSIIIGGTFTSVGGSARNGLARISATGALDRSFNPRLSEPFTLYVGAVAVQPDGKILVGGRFTTLAGEPAQGFGRLNADGSRDTTFTGGVSAQTFATNVYGIALQADGRIIVSGAFEKAAGVPRASMAMFNADGTCDPDVSFLSEGSVMGMCMKGDGTLLATGTLRPRSTGIRELAARFLNRPATQSLTAASPRRVQWLRGGSSPEASTVFFASGPSADGPWTALGEGTRSAAGGWELPLASAPLPVRGFLRGQARIPSGFQNGSMGMVETVTPFELIPDIAVRDGAGPEAPPLASGQTSPVDFGTVRQGSAASRVVTVENQGNGDLQFSGVLAPEGFRFVNPPAFPIVVEAGAQLALQLQIDAASPGVASGTVVLNSSDPDEGAFQFPVSGTVVSPEIVLHSGAGTAGPELTSGQGTAVDFGTNIQGTPGLREFTVSNTGSAPLLIQSITVPEGFTLSPAAALPATVATGASLKLEVSLTSLAVGPHAGLVTILNDDLDEGSFTFPVSGEVFIPAPLATVSGSSTTLNRQTGFREQTIHLANDTTATVPGYRLIIRGLPAGVTVGNAAEIRADGGVVVLVTQALAPHSAFDLVLEYASATRQPSEISPEIAVEVVLDTQGPAPSDGTGTLAIERLVPMADGAMLLEFAAIAGVRYTVEYSNDGSAWKTSPVAVQAAGNRCQWIDRGPPRTDSQPAQTGKRFYRVRLSPPQAPQ